MQPETKDMFYAQVTILEASARIGGRIHTYYGRDWFAELGAMRFPKFHPIVQEVSRVDIFKGVTKKPKKFQRIPTCYSLFSGNGSQKKLSFNH